MDKEPTQSTKPDQKVLPKRFYKEVSYRESGDGFEVLLDERTVKTPLKNILSAPTKTLAQALVDEWDNQKISIDPATMFLTKMLNTATDHVSAHIDAVIDELVTYAGTDMLCYRASDPESLVEAQNKKWDPLLTWMEREYGVRLKLAEGIIHQAQDESSLQKIKEYLLAKPHYFIAGFHALTTLSGSVTIAIACSEGEISVEEAWDCAHLEANWQSERWGVDEEATIARNNAFQEFKAAAFLVKNI